MRRSLILVLCLTRLALAIGGAHSSGSIWDGLLPILAIQGGICSFVCPSTALAFYLKRIQVRWWGWPLAFFFGFFAGLLSLLIGVLAIASAALAGVLMALMLDFAAVAATMYGVAYLCSYETEDS